LLLIAGLMFCAGALSDAALRGGTRARLERHLNLETMKVAELEDSILQLRYEIHRQERTIGSLVREKKTADAQFREAKSTAVALMRRVQRHLQKVEQRISSMDFLASSQKPAIQSTTQ
jgi:hypothetical protein